jgi:hypothetical protein
VSLLTQFMNTDLSAFYFDIRKDALYCEPISSIKRKAALETIEQIFRCTCVWLAPLMCFTAEEAWLARYPSETASVHAETFPKLPASWRDDALAEEWEQIKRVRRVVTGALEIERANKRIGSSLEAAPQVFIDDDELEAVLEDIDFAEVCITSGVEIVSGEAPDGAFKLPDVANVGVVPKPAQGKKCARSWRITTDVGSDPAFPDLSARDAACRARVRCPEGRAAVTSWLYGPLSQLGYTLMVLTIAFDQAHKWWMLLIYRIQDKGRVTVTPFLDLVYVKNTGVSYGMFLQEASRANGCWRDLPRWQPGDGRLAGRGVTDKLVAASLGLIMGGALSNAIDRS